MSKIEMTWETDKNIAVILNMKREHYIKTFTKEELIKILNMHKAFTIINLKFIEE